MHPWKHFCTITRHRHKVMLHCFKAGIGLQGLFHDLSKYSLSEFCAGARYYQGSRSPNEAEREVYGYSNAWMHHKGRNKHHFEYWTDYDPKTKKISPVKMPEYYVVEMFCDRVAASKIYAGKAYNDHHPVEYFMKGKASLTIHPDSLKFLEYLLLLLDERGEKEAFATIRKLVRSHSIP